MPKTEEYENGKHTAVYNLTKREHMATQIFAGICANNSVSGTAKDAAKYAVAYADALLAELAESEGK